MSHFYPNLCYHGNLYNWTITNNDWINQPRIIASGNKDRFKSTLDIFQESSIHLITKHSEIQGQGNNRPSSMWRGILLSRKIFLVFFNLGIHVVKRRITIYSFFYISFWPIVKIVLRRTFLSSHFQHLLIFDDVDMIMELWLIVNICNMAVGGGQRQWKLGRVLEQTDHLNYGPGSSPISNHPHLSDVTVRFKNAFLKILFIKQ